MKRSVRIAVKAAIVALAFASLLIFAGVAPSVQAVSRADNGCDAKLNNPHVSKGAGGVIAKATWVCSTAPVKIDLLSPGDTSCGCANRTQRGP